MSNSVEVVHFYNIIYKDGLGKLFTLDSYICLPNIIYFMEIYNTKNRLFAR